ncbi:MAG TPA: alkene reductase [Pseudonocardiaceae bacterium]|nr:alkene reductase [Pseudonocardiaceae bacterium]
MTSTFDPVTVGKYQLANRIVMAPMSRSRAYGPGACPAPSTARYYRQRATAGLIISEGIQPSPVGQGYPATTGLYSAEQVAGWRAVTEAVHEAGGVIFGQLMHAGRIGHPSNLPAGLRPVAPSAIAANAKVFTSEGPKDCVVPHELSAAEIAGTIAEFTTAANNAMAAGFDGVEIHGANGFLPHQFLADNTNRRSDEWGGSIEGRIRFAVALASAVSGAVGGERVGFQISPGNPYNDIVETNIQPTYLELVAALDRLNLAYLNVSETQDRALTTRLRAGWSSAFILNPGTTPGATGPADLGLVADGTTDLLSFGALFLANPDLPHRLALGGPFNEPDRATFYGGGDHGYIDYPSLYGSIA